MPASVRLRHLLTLMVVVIGVGVWRLMVEVDHDRFSALVTGVILGACLYVCLRPLGFSPASPPMLYLGVFALFHLGMVLPWALGLYRDMLPRWFVFNRVTPALGLVELAIAAYLAGLLHGSPGHRAETRLDPGPSPVYTNQFLFFCGLAIYVAGCAMFFIGVESLGGMRFYDAGYAETYRLAAQFDPRFFGNSFTIVPIGLYLAAASFPRRWAPLVLAIAVVWAGGIFYLGFRGFALIPALVIIALLRYRGFRAPGWVNVALALLVLAAIPIARAVRDQGARQRSFSDLFRRVRLLDGVTEMGGSLRPLVHTINYLENEPWRWGTTYWRSLHTVWPNLARRWEGASYVPLEDLPPNHWLTVQAEPDMYRHYGGLGFSAVAEPYMNFGVPGVLAYFWGLGALLARTAEFRSPRPMALAAWAMVFGPLLWTTRNSFEIFFRPTVWGLAVVAAAWFFSGVVAAPSLRRGPFPQSSYARISG